MKSLVTLGSEGPRSLVDGKRPLLHRIPGIELLAVIAQRSG
jgi:hypothetical protein